jgi:hypothetical protein
MNELAITMNTTILLGTAFVLWAFVSDNLAALRAPVNVPVKSTNCRQSQSGAVHTLPSGSHRDAA